MKMKKILPVVIVMTLLLTACGAASRPSASATPVKVPTLAILPTPVSYTHLTLPTIYSV